MSSDEQTAPLVHSDPPLDAAAVTSLTDALREAIAPNLILQQQLGHGGMGLVFLARDPALKRLVVIKVLAPWLAASGEARKRFVREAEAAAALAHPNVVSVFQVGEVAGAGISYYVMQYVDGQSLQEMFRPSAAMPEHQARHIVGEIAMALAAAHALGVVHRDIKPANVMLEREGGRVIVVDFGISAVLERGQDTPASKLTAEGVSLGTPQYMSPEQAAGQPVSERSDVYSLGVLAFELVTGRLPVGGQTWWELAAAHIKDAPPRVADLRPDLDAGFADVIDRCLHKDAAKRPAAQEIVRALLPAARGAIEWPPPGLERVRGVGASLVRLLLLTAWSGALFQLSLLWQPEAADAVVIGGQPYTYAVLGSVLVLLAVAAKALVRAVSAAGALAGARRAGYPWPVVLDTAVDTSRETGLLLSGAGPYALLTPEHLARLMRLRRLRAGVLMATAAAGLLVQAVWALGGGGWVAPTTTRLLTATEWLVLLMPLVVGTVVAVALGEPEQRLRPARRRVLPWRSTPMTRPELVDAWLQRSGRGARSGGPRRLRLLLASLLVGLPVVLALAAAVTALVAIKTENARMVANPHGSRQVFTVDSLRPMDWPAFEALVADAARFDPRRAPDLEAARLVVAARLSGGERRPDRYAVVDSSALAALPPLGPGQCGGRAVTTKGHLVRLGIQPELRPDYARDTLTPWLAVWSRFARSGPLPPLWSVDERASYAAVWHQWWNERPVLMQLACRAAVAGWLRLAAGDREGGRRRAREILAAGRHYLGSPLMYQVFGGLDLIEVGQTLLHRSAAGDPVLLQEAELLANALARVRSDLRRLRLASLSVFVDPGDTTGLALLSDMRLAPAQRVLLARMAGVAACINAREVLFGPDPRRHALLRSAGARLADLPRGEMVVRAFMDDGEQMVDGLHSVAYMRSLTAQVGARAALVARVFPIPVTYRASTCTLYTWL